MGLIEQTSELAAAPARRHRYLDLERATDTPEAVDRDRVEVATFDSRDRGLVKSRLPGNVDLTPPAVAPNRAEGGPDAKVVHELPIFPDARVLAA